MNKKRGRISNHGQVWIETVIYTLMGLAIIGILLSVITPRIKQMSDKIVISQSITLLNEVNEKISNVLVSSDSKRALALYVKKGEIIISPLENRIYFQLSNSGLKYSAPNITIGKDGDVMVRTVDLGGKKYNIILYLNYNNFNLTYQDKENNKTFTAGSTPYNLLIENKGGIDRKININEI